MRPAAQVVEPVRGWWTGNAAFGREETLVPPGDREFAIGSIDQMPGPPRARTVSLYRSPIPAGVGPEPVPTLARAIVVYGAGGVQNSLELDFAFGSQFSVVCDTIRIGGRVYDAGGAAIPVVPATRQTFGFTVGEGSFAAALPATWTSFTSVLGAGGSMQVPVPEFARTAALRTTLVAASGWELRGRDDSGAISWAVDGSRAVGGVTIDGQTRAVEVQADATVGNFLTRLVFGLGL